MTKKNKMVVGGLMTLVIGLGMASSALAYRGDYTQTGPNHTAEREAQMIAVMNNGDYDGWKTLMESKMNNRGRVTQVINQDNFAKFAEAWKLGKSGEIEKAKAIRSELGLRGSNGDKLMDGTGHGFGRGGGMGRFAK